MNARKRTHSTQIAELKSWLSPFSEGVPQSFLGLVSKDQFCLVAIRDLVDLCNFYDRESRKHFALGLVCSTVSAVLPARRYEPDRATKTGKQWKAIKEFPARFRSCADEVEKLNKGLWFNPRSWVMDDRVTEDQFAGLPSVMRSFASYIEERAKEVANFSGRTYKGKYSPNLYSLMESVMDATGNYRDTQVCNLLQAAANALNVKMNCSEQALMDYRQDRRDGNPKNTSA